MKKALVFLFLSLFLLWPPNALGQSLYDAYLKAESDFQVARAEYERYQTLKSKDNYETSLAARLKAEDVVIVDYLVRVGKLAGGDKLTSEAGWYTDRLAEMDKLSDLKALALESTNTEQKYDDSKMIVYDALFEISNRNIDNSRDSLNLIIERTRVELERIRANGDKDTALMEKWLATAQEEIEESKVGQAEAQKIFTKAATFSSSDRKAAAFEDAQKGLGKSKGWLISASRRLSEIIREIKTND